MSAIICFCRSPHWLLNINMNSVQSFYCWTFLQNHTQSIHFCHPLSVFGTLSSDRIMAIGSYSTIYQFLLICHIFLKSVIFISKTLCRKLLSVPQCITHSALLSFFNHRIESKTPCWQIFLISGKWSQPDIYTIFIR